MWIVPRDTNGLKSRTAIPEALRSALVRWYVGSGSDADHRAAVSLVVTARENAQWIACDCLSHEQTPPLISPAYLSEAETYYLRRLTGRPHHHRRCPLYLPPSPDRIRERPNDSLFEIEYPKGLFSAHKEAPEKLAQKPLEDDPDDRSRGVAIPRLGRLMWMLLEAGHTNVLPPLPPHGSPNHGLNHEFARLHAAAERFEIAPHVKLSDHLYFNVKQWESRRVQARLREAERAWPEGHAPQAFLVLEAHAISGTTIHTGLGDLDIRNRIQHTGIIRAKVEPPFIALVVIGEHNPREGYLPLRAYAQPVFKGNRFIPVDRHSDRVLLETLTTLQYKMRRKRVELAVKKPLFDVVTHAGMVRPDAIVAFLDHRTGLEADFAIQLLRERSPQYLEMKALERKRFEEFHRTMTLDVRDLENGDVMASLEQMIDDA
ncbi:hypothetical protein [Novosphingobium album (ex Hu et al. 2023)]|uniref:DUF1173 family protein n=1 Tax=Novosphingobium album (ex Hu et al. 2023) TaxID=2930093 RepID=A0ABT0B4W5_9SPHN|nr:hypothetical protein [Novosphingobium album (ex Hu et al. 2023)]MCJ2180080.1 hypothetical protein [Novosphingobium album (ex Hu et al. 2023)]